ncbi:MAG: phage tail sheath family protein [Anaerolineae bacterium]|nr:phage tail sheath family protein [Anaerolineae bacterium]
MAKTDMERGVWKAPAGLDAAIQGIKGLQFNMNDAQNGFLNPKAVNALRYFDPAGPVVWGARTLRGEDAISDDFKYVPVRRLANYLELSLQRGTKWAVFEPNDEQLWSALRISIGSFLKGLKSQGGILDYQVICNETTTTPDDQLQGIVNVWIRYKPVYPAEFVVLQFQIEGVQLSS